jgi:hypothetical protein
VHCTVRARLVEDPTAKDRLLKTLIDDHEPPYAEQWRGLGEEFARKMLAGIVGFELEVTEWQCKLKLNQHRPESHAALRARYAEGNEHERALGRWMDHAGDGADVSANHARRLRAHAPVAAIKADPREYRRPVSLTDLPHRRSVQSAVTAMCARPVSDGLIQRRPEPRARIEWPSRFSTRTTSVADVLS